MAESFGAGGIDGVESAATFGLAGIVKESMAIRANAEDVRIDVETVVKCVLAVHRDDVVPFDVVLPSRFGDEGRMGWVDLAEKMGAPQCLLNDDAVTAPSRRFDLPSLWQSLGFDGDVQLFDDIALGNDQNGALQDNIGNVSFLQFPRQHRVDIGHEY